jgi:hypothetical protein
MHLEAITRKNNSRRWKRERESERATVGGESDEEKASAVSEETERATVGGESDREREEEESTKKPNAFESEESERATVGSEMKATKIRNHLQAIKRKNSSWRWKQQRESERATVGGENDKEKA